jgi:integral membrane protein
MLFLKLPIFQSKNHQIKNQSYNKCKILKDLKFALFFHPVYNINNVYIKMLQGGAFMLNTAIGRLRLLGLIEGISYLVLLGVAMPLKYFAGFPVAVTIAGSLHGLFFVLFILAVLHVMFVHRWSIMRGITAFITSLLPFGTFILDAQLKKEYS